MNCTELQEFQLQRIRIPFFVPMAVFFILTSFILILFFSLLIPSFSFSCPIHPSCDSNMDIYYPFYTDNTVSGCNGTYLIHCNDSSTATTLPHQQSNSRTICKEIWCILSRTYLTQTKLSQFNISSSVPYILMIHTAASCIYDFAHPIPHFDTPHHPIIDDLDRSISSCSWGKHDFSLLDTNYNYSVCKDFYFYYWTESEEDLPQGIPTACRARKAPLFELRLSFDKHINLKTIILAAGVGGTTGLVAACCIFLWCYSSISRKKNLKNDHNVENFLKIHGSLAPKRYKYSDVKKITESFRHKFGQGGYGSVFKGTLSDGRSVAVKVLNKSKGIGEDFFNEIASIGRSSHVNVVNLLGFCSQGSKRALIYEYMCNGSLDKLIRLEKRETSINWEKLYQIAIGIARGLEYLHRGSNTRIVHFDIKPHNILLDQDFCPKISDFGLSKLCLRKDSILSMEGTRGTVGYIAPEVFSRNFGIVSSKSDVYSYRMVILEMVGARENVPLGDQNTSETYFPYSIYKHLEQNQGLQVYGTTAETEELVRKMMLIGLWCIQTIPQNRPSITKVIEMLEGSVHNLQVPPKPYLSFPSFGPAVEVSSVQESCSQDCISTLH